MKKIIIANWKMNPLTLKESLSYFNKISKSFSKIRKIEVVIAPPFLFLEKLSKISRKIFLGAQNCLFGDVGAFTGEISPVMLSEIGVKYVILGHSERREMGETDDLINKKIKSALNAGLVPIVCIGEKERDLEHNYFSFISAQLKNVFTGISKDSLSKIIIAYEPIWAISSTKDKKEAKVEEIKEMVIFIRKVLSDAGLGILAKKMRIIYGGSVEPKNIQSILTEGNVDGLLVGKASLSMPKFAEIISITESI